MLRVRQDVDVLAGGTRLRAQGARGGRLGGPPRSRGEGPQRVPRSGSRAPRARGKTSRVHLDLYTTDQEGEVQRLIGLGASRYPQEYRPDADFIVLEDPDGNRFCVVQVPDQSYTTLRDSSPIDRENLKADFLELRQRDVRRTPPP